MLDSGEADTYRYDQPKRGEIGNWSINNGPLRKGTKKYPVRNGVLRQFIDPLTQISMTGFFINTNKTADIGKDEESKGYEVPWQNEEAQYWLVRLRNWQEKFNPIYEPTAWIDLEVKHLGSVKDQSILKQMGYTCFLFRSAADKGTNKSKPVTDALLVTFWYNLLSELQTICNIQDGLNFRFVKDFPTTEYPLHSLRVSLITAYALDGGVPMPILSKCIAGHARLVMTLYYTRLGITYVTETMNEAEMRILEEDQASFLRWVKEADYKALEAYSASNDPNALQAVINAQRSGGVSLIPDDKGICPKGGFGCDSGGVYINDETDKITYGPVPGHPEHNCIRCRWFLTGPAFLPGLMNHFNVLSYNISEIRERKDRLANEIEEIENLRFKSEQTDSHFPIQKSERLSKLEKLYQQEIQKFDKLANDMNATIRLIDRCKATANMKSDEEELNLIAVGSIKDIEIVIDSDASKLIQLQTICNGATIFTETDYSKAVLQRSQILDLALALNGQKPIFFTLTPEEQLLTGNEWMRLLIKRVGSLKGAIPYAEGRKKLAEIGFDYEPIKLIQDAIQGKTQLSLPPSP
jgi:hypothetical protein